MIIRKGSAGRPAWLQNFGWAVSSQAKWTATGLDTVADDAQAIDAINALLI